jgi:hypothetical protein
MTDETPAHSPRRFWRRFGVLFGAGFIGVVALIPMILPAIRVQLQLPGAPPLPLVVFLSVLQTSVLLGAAVAIGIHFAPRFGLRSHLDGWAWRKPPGEPTLRRELPVALALGVAAASLMILIDLLTRRWVETELLRMAAQMERPIWHTAVGMLYGGITEELMTRWGLMTLLVLLAAVVGRSGVTPGRGAFWFAIVTAAVIFGMGHLPAVAAATSLTPPIITRTIVLNGIGGIVYGWLFWRSSLEAAMIAHASAHVVFAIANAVALTIIS